MANQKPKKVAKKPSTKPEAKKEALATPAVQTASAEPSLKGFFARKCDKNENILTIFKSPRIWGALIAELLGTMMIVMLLLTLGLAQPLYLIFAVVAVYVMMAGLSGANLNPIITVGMMATRRMSAIRGVLYILAQVLGAWIGLIIINAFRLSSGTVGELPMMEEVTGETFWVVALVELLGAVIIAFCFARTLRYVRKNPLTFAFAIAGAMTLVIVVATIIANGYFGLADSFIFNPAAALMYQILPTTADGIGELLGMAGLALAAYVVFPMVGGGIGFYIADVATKLSAGGYLCEDDCVCDK